MTTKEEEQVPVATAVSSSDGVTPTHEMPVFSPQRIVAEFKDFATSFRMTPGDWGSLTQLFFDNLSTLLGALFAVQAIATFAVPTDITNEINNVVWGKIVPGVGFTLCLGNIYYSWMAIRLTKKYGRPYTAQPYGLNTPQAFAFVFNVMCTYSIPRQNLIDILFQTNMNACDMLKLFFVATFAFFLQTRCISRWLERSVQPKRLILDIVWHWWPTLLLE